MCVWVHRWSLCPVPRDTEHFSQPPSSSVIDPGQPWLSWKHEQLAGPEILRKFGLEAPNGFVVAHHRVISKRRCASWGTHYCNEAPREIHTQLFKSACSECTGEDRCDSLNIPYRTDVSGHHHLSAEQHEKLNRAVAEYWRYGMLAKIAQLSEFIPDFDGLTENPGQLNPNSCSLFFDLVCVEDLEHVHAMRGETSDCEWCNNINFPPAHNLSRAIRRQEALSALQNDFDTLMHQFDLLESDGYLSRFRRLQGEDRAPQDWCPPEPQWDRVNAWHFEIARLGDMIIRQGPDSEDKRFREHLDGRQPQNTWHETIRDRVYLAKHVATELTHDPGLSETFFNKLFGHVASLLLPCPDPKERWATCNPPYPHPPGEPITAQVIRHFDRAVREYRGEIMDGFERSNSLMRYLSIWRDSIVVNSKHAAISIRSDLEACAVGIADAQRSESFCSICLEPWLDLGDIPVHCSIVALPCCAKPVHGRCLKPLLRARAHRPTCPLCRANLVDRGWFGSVFQEHFRQDSIIEEGLVPLVFTASSTPSRGSQLDAEYVANTEELNENTTQREGNQTAHAGRSEIERDGDNAGLTDGVLRPRPPSIGDEGPLDRAETVADADGNNNGVVIDSLNRFEARSLPQPMADRASVEYDDGSGERERTRSHDRPKTPITPKPQGGVRRADVFHVIGTVSYGPRDIEEDAEGLMAAPRRD